MRILGIRTAIAGVLIWFGLLQVSHADDITSLEPISIVTAQSATLFTAEIADNDQLRAKGLMFRQLMPADHAMLFDFNKPRPAAMWMKNTYVSLDMLFVRQDGTIAAVAENTEPFSLQTISVEEPVRGVIELAAGTAKRLGIHRNDKVYHRIFQTEQQ